MSSSGLRGFFAAIIVMAPGAALAQNRAALPPGAVVQPLDTGPGAELRRNLMTLADNPRSVMALLGAGRASLQMGDAEAAFGFFARASEVEPQSARAKAGMASALVLMGQPREALPLFSEALALGAPEAEIAADRGLAYDSLGDPRRAQADYTLALRNRDEPEVRRRMALSLAISGQRDAALRMIDGQIRNNDRAGWRTQAFVLALTGDTAGAERIARTAMPPGGAAAMAPFFDRLPHLSAAQKAMAVHFGHFPSDGRTAVAANVETRSDPGAMALAEARPPAPPPERARPAEPVGGDERVASLIPRRPPPEVAPAVRREPPPRPDPQPEQPTAGFTLIPQGPQPGSQPPGSRLDGVAELVASLPADEPVRAAAPQPRATETRRAAETRTVSQRNNSRSPRQAAAPNPSRHWVQIATGANRSALPLTFRNLREQAPALLGSRTPYAARATSTNRLLIGPFESERAAQAVVNQLRQRRIAAVTWTSDAGQEIERLRIQNEPRTSRSRPEPEPRPAARRRRTN